MLPELSPAVLQRLYEAGQTLRAAASLDEVFAVLQAVLLPCAPTRIAIDGLDGLLYTWSAGPEAPDPDAGLEIPLQTGGRVIGRLNIAPAPPPADQTFLAALANQAAAVIDNWVLRRHAEQALQQADLLQEISSAMAEVSSAQGVLEALAQPAAERGELALAQLYLLQDGRGWTDADATVAIEASWTSGFAPDLTGLRFSAADLPIWDTLAAPAILTVDDLVAARDLPLEAQVEWMTLGLQALAILPLEVSSRPVGAVLLGYPVPHVHTARELAFFRNLAELTVIALQNINLFAQTERRARQMQTSSEVSRAVTSILDIADLLPLIVNLIRDSFRYDHVQVFLVDDAGENAVLKASTGEVGATLLKLNWSLAVGSNSVIGQVTRYAEPVIALDTADARVAHRPNPYLPDTRSEMAIPLVSRGRVIGALDVQSRQPSAFTEEDVRVLSSLADQIAIALDNARLFEQTQNYTRVLTRQVANLETLLAASQRFTAMQNAQDILDSAAQALVEMLRVDHAGIVLELESDPQYGILRAEYPPSDLIGSQLHIIGPWMNEEYVFTREPVAINSVATSPLLDDETRHALLGGGIRQVVLVPFLTSGERVTGSIGLDMIDGERVFSYEDITLLQLFATQIGSAYQNALSFARAQRQAEDLRFLFEVTTAAAEGPTLEASMRTVAGQVQAAIPSDVVGVFLRAADSDYLDRVAIAALGPGVSLPARLPFSGWIAQQARRERSPFLLSSLDAVPQASDLGAGELRSLIVTPLFSGNEITGLILLLRREMNAYSEANLRVLQALSGSISAVVQNIRLLEEVRAANDRLRELDRVKSQFLANMSHELRTPLNSIIGFSRVILKGIDGPVTDMQAQDLETIYSSGQHLLTLINDILDQAKIEAEKLTLSIGWFDLTGVVEAARSMSVGLLKDRPVRMAVELQRDLPRVWGDELRTRQVLLNLLSNAAKFTHEGSITVTAFTVQQPDGPYVQLAVSDTGIGIPADKIESAFVAFEQVDGTLTRTSGGTGLGLPISRSLIEMMGGRLWVESTVNVGSTFSFIIPAFAKETGRAAAEAQPPDVPLPAGDFAAPDRKLVMVIDGDISRHQEVRSLLNQAGYTVEATANLISARDMITLTLPDIILLSMGGSGEESRALLGWLAANKDTAHIPIILRGAPPEEAAGAVLTLPESLTPEALVAAVRQVEADYMHSQVLVIDDRPESLRLGLEALRAEPRLAVQIATSAQEGLAIIARRRPDVVLLDLNLPDMDGFEVLNRIRSNPRTQDLPVLIVTVEDAPAAQWDAALSGVSVYSKTTGDPAALLAAVRALLADGGQA